jgi:hypothetical protein
LRRADSDASGEEGGGAQRYWSNLALCFGGVLLLFDFASETSLGFLVGCEENQVPRYAAYGHVEVCVEHLV